MIIDTPSSNQNQQAIEAEIEQSLYAKRQKIYPREVHGIFATLRGLSAASLLGLFYGLPWLRWDDHQAVLFDLPARKFYIFGLILWPQDFIYLAMLLIIAGLSLFFFTALAGRLWCGYACPQTVWTEVFLWSERLIEGDHLRQKKLDKLPWTPNKIRIKTTKHLFWLIFALFTGFTFVAYFIPINDLFQRTITLQLTGWETFWILFYSFATYGNAGWMREQVCLYMCPYARFQSAMFDGDTFVIGYDKTRGEPRGSRKSTANPRTLGLGDCIDCRMCVQVCPTGIDIRKGLQYECIGCASCIDICDQVMEKMSYAPGLIRYATENSLKGRQPRILRPRIIVYGVILLTLLTTLAYSVFTRVPIGLDVIRDRNQLYRETDEGLIENVYTLKIMNMDGHAHRFKLAAQGLEGLALISEQRTIIVASGQVVSLPIRLQAEESALKTRSSAIIFSLSTIDEPHLKITEKTRFLGPRHD